MSGVEIHLSGVVVEQWPQDGVRETCESACCYQSTNKMLTIVVLLGNIIW